MGDLVPSRRDDHVHGVPVRLPPNLPERMRDEVLEFVGSSTAKLIREAGGVTKVVIDVVLDVAGEYRMAAAYYRNRTKVFIEEVVPVTGRVDAYQLGLDLVRRPGLDPELAALGEQMLRRNFSR